MGLVMSRVECSRCWLYQVWIQLAMSCLAWVLVTYRRLLIRSCWRVEKNDSAAALSKAEPTLPMDWRACQIVCVRVWVHGFLAG